MPLILLLIAAVLFLILKLNSAKITGAAGEAKVNARLHFLGAEYISLHDVMLPNGRGATSQIDHLVLSEYGIFVIETKRYKGWIFGSEKAENWTQVIFKEKHQFRNPVKQNWSHVYALKSVLTDFPRAKYHPIVVFAGSATLKDIDSSVPVIYETALNSTIRSASTEKCLSGDDVLRIKALLESKEVTERGARKEHVRAVQQDAQERRMKMSNLICPRCGGALKPREGRHGSFYGCANYPRCRFTMPR